MSCCSEDPKLAGLEVGLSIPMYRDYFFKAGVYFPFFSLMASGGLKNWVFKKMGKNIKKKLDIREREW